MTPNNPEQSNCCQAKVTDLKAKRKELCLTDGTSSDYECSFCGKPCGLYNPKQNKPRKHPKNCKGCVEPKGPGKITMARGPLEPPEPRLVRSSLYS